MTLLAQFSALPRASWYPVYSLEQVRSAHGGQPAVLQLSYVPMLRFAEKSSVLVPDDSFVVVTRVDREGKTILEEVVQAPKHELLLRLFASQMGAVRRRPLQRNGSSLEAYLIVPYQKISVVG